MLGLAAVPALAVSAQDDIVEGLVINGAEAPLPMVGDGAPNYSPEQTASAICAALDQGYSARSMFNLERAHQATVRARQARLQHRLGAASDLELRNTELQRQNAVAPHVISHVRFRELPASHNESFAIEDLAYQREMENGRAVMIVTGKVRNTTASELPLPPVNLFAIDVRDFALAGQTSHFEPESLGAGETHAFTLRFRNPPLYTARVHATFAPPFQTRNFRGCSFLDPASYDPRNISVDKLHTVVGARSTRPTDGGAPAYTAAELAALGRVAYADAIRAFDAGDRARRGDSSAVGCAPVQPWRSLMDLADLIEEAWIATNAAEESRREAGLFLPEEIAAAERARQKAVNAFIAARPARLQAGGAAPMNLTIEDVRRDGGEQKVVVRAAMRNTGNEPVPAPPVLVTFTDRFGFVFTETIHYKERQVRPGRDYRFDVEIPAPISLVGDAKVEFAC